MPGTIKTILGNPGIRVSAIAIFFFGLSNATIAPYLSIIGIQELGLRNRDYALLIFCASCVNVSASVFSGILADRMGHFRLPMMVIAAFGIAGYGMVYFFPAAGVFVVAVLFFLPVYNALNSMIFANVRYSSEGMTVRELVSVNSGVRAVISASWVLVPGLVGFIMAGRQNMLPAFLFAAMGCVVCFLLFLIVMPKTGAKHITSTDYAFFASLGKIWSLSLLLRLLSIALISSMMQMSGVVLPLVMTGMAGGRPGDVGIVVGSIAFLEIVFIIFWGQVEKKTGTLPTLIMGALFYCSYLLLLGVVSRPAMIYLLIPLAGLGAAAIISVPITYLQNLIADRAGLGSSLIAVNIFLSGGLNALLFGLGTRFSSYSGTAMIGAVAGICGVVLLSLLERKTLFGSRRLAA